MFCIVFLCGLHCPKQVKLRIFSFCNKMKFKNQVQHTIICKSLLESALLEGVFSNFLVVESQSYEMHLLGKKLWLSFRKLSHCQVGITSG